MSSGYVLADVVVARRHSWPVQVRAGALAAVGSWLGNAAALDALGQSTPLCLQAATWAESIGDALLDSAHAVCAAAFAAIRSELCLNLPVMKAPS